MAVKIRLSRAGTKKVPYYKIMVADERKSRDGKFIENIGTYDPKLPKTSQDRVKIKTDRVNYWLSVGAQPSETIAKFLKAANIAQDIRITKEANQRRLKSIKSTQARIEAEKLKAAADAKAADDKAKAEEAAKAAAAAAASAPAEQAAAPQA